MARTTNSSATRTRLMEGTSRPPDYSQSRRAKRSLRKEIRDGDPNRRQTQWRGRFRRSERAQGGVAPPMVRCLVDDRLAIELQDAIDEIHDPVVREAGARVHAPFL